MLSGWSVGAEEALAIGLVDRVAPLEELDQAVRASLAEAPGRARAARAVPETHRALAAFFDALSVAALPDAPPSSADPRVAGAVKRLRTRAPIALRLAAELIERGLGLPIEDGLELELGHLEEIFSTADAYEGLSSLGGRPAVFTGA